MVAPARVQGSCTTTAAALYLSAYCKDLLPRPHYTEGLQEWVLNTNKIIISWYEKIVEQIFSGRYFYYFKISQRSCQYQYNKSYKFGLSLPQHVTLKPCTDGHRWHTHTDRCKKWVRGGGMLG